MTVIQGNEGAVATAALIPIAQNNAHYIWQHLNVGAPSNVIFWIVLGAAFGVYNKREENKGNLIGKFFMSFVLSLAIVVGGPHWTGTQWDNEGYQAAMGMVLAFTAQNWGPNAMKFFSKLDIREILATVFPQWIKPRNDNERN